MSAQKRPVTSDVVGGQPILLLAAYAIVAVVLVAAIFEWSSNAKPSSTANIKKGVGLRVGAPPQRAEFLSGNGTALPDEGQDNAAPRIPKLPANLAALLAEMRQIAMLPDSPEREKELEALINSLPERDVSAIVVFLGKTFPFGPQDAIFNRLVSRWGNIDALAAASWIDGLQSGALREQTANIIAILWANKDIPGVGNWIAQWPKGKDRDDIVTNIVYEAARQSPTQAMNLAMNLLPDEPMSKLIIYATSQWATEAPADAAKWTEQIDDESIRNQALVGVATSWAATDPDAAANLALTGIPPGRQQDDAVVGIVERWIQTDPRGVSQWVAQFNAGSIRDTAIQNMVSIWTDKDPSGVAQWLGNLPAGQVRDSAVGAYIAKLAIASPGEAARWAQTLRTQP